MDSKRKCGEKMNKSSKKDFDSIKRFGLKWEFVRRNKEYKKDYNKFIKAKTKKGKNKLIKIIQEKYELGEPMDPEISFLKPPEEKNDLDAGIYLYKISQNAMGGKPSVCAHDYEYGLYLYSEISSLVAEKMNLQESYGKEELKSKKMITVQINIDAPKQRILNDVENIVERWKALKKEKEVLPKERARVENYEYYLNVVDLKDDKGLDWDVIIKGKNYKKYDDRVYAKKVARRDYERGKKMIEGGFRQIR